MPHINCFKNSAESGCEEFRDKSETAPLTFCTFCTFDLRNHCVYRQLCFTVVLFCSQSLQPLKDIPIDFPVHTISNNQKLKDQFHYQ